MSALVVFLAWVLAVTIAVRCFCVLHKMDMHSRRCSYGWFLAFGLSYATLMIAALGAAIHISEGHGITGDWLFLLASAGMIVFDRRRRRAAPEGGK